MRADWELRLEEIKQLAETKTRHEAAAILGTSVDNYRSICKRYGINIRERKEYNRCNNLSDRVAVEKESRLIEARNKLLTRRWG
jgi:hypothetical protein